MLSAYIIAFLLQIFIFSKFIQRSQRPVNKLELKNNSFLSILFPEFKFHLNYSGSVNIKLKAIIPTLFLSTRNFHSLEWKSVNREQFHS